MLDKIDSPTEYINAVTKLMPYAIGKKRPVVDEELDFEPIIINIDIGEK